MNAIRASLAESGCTQAGFFSAKIDASIAFYSVDVLWYYYCRLYGDRLREGVALLFV